MVDLLTIVLTHALMLVAAWRLLSREELDREDFAGEKETRPWLVGRGGAAAGEDRPDA